MFPGCPVDHPEGCIDVVFSGWAFSVPELLFSGSFVCEIGVSENILFWYIEYCHEVFYQSSNRGPLLGRESWTDHLYSESVVVEAVYTSPERLSSVPGDLFWIGELVGITVGVNECECRHRVGRLIFGPVRVGSREYLNVTLERSWRSGRVVYDDEVTGVFYSLGVVPLGFREVFFP